MLLSAATFACLLGVLSPAWAGAATISPTPGFVADDFTNNANCSLREAIEVANENFSGSPEDSCNITGDPLGNDTVNLSGNVYTLSLTGAETGAGNNGVNDLDVGQAGSGTLTVAGQGANSTTIATATGWQDRVLETFSTGTVTINSLNVTGGNNAPGFGFDDGGGIRSTSPLVLNGVRVDGNAAAGAGGGLYSAAAVTVADSQFSLNHSAGGGLSDSGGGIAISTIGETASIDDSVIRDNTVEKASPSGGGLFTTSSSGLTTVTDTVIAGNEAHDPGITGTAFGGGVRAVGPLALRRVTVSGNKVTGGLASSGNANSAHGAGIDAQGNVTLVNATVSGNEAVGTGGYGGGIRVDGGAVTMVNSTVASNAISPAETGSAIFVGAGSLSMRASIIETFGGAPACSGFLALLGDNVLTDGTCGTLGPGDLANADPELRPLGDDGGPRVGAPQFLQPLETQSPELTSDAVDRVAAADCDDTPSGDLTVDARGAPRPFDGDGDSTADCDSGAVEDYTCLGDLANRVGTDGSDTISGTAGSDAIAALGGSDEVFAGDGNDSICGGAGDDELAPGSGIDEIDGGSDSGSPPGGDFAVYSDSASPISADLQTGEAAGDGTDTFAPGTIENLLGSAGPDILGGDAEANLIGGGSGDDQINGRGGDDQIDGQSDVDEIVFTGAPGPVVASIQSAPGSATGFGTDILVGFERITGGPFGDTLTGNLDDNLLRGAGGSDTLKGLEGADDYQAQDGLGDTIDCTGGGADSGAFDPPPAETFVSCPNADGDAVADLADACPAQPGTEPNGCLAPAQPPGPPPGPGAKKCKKGKKLKKGKCVKKKKGKRK